MCLRAQGRDRIEARCLFSTNGRGTRFESVAREKKWCEELVRTRRSRVFFFEPLLQKERLDCSSFFFFYLSLVFQDFKS